MKKGHDDKPRFTARRLSDMKKEDLRLPPQVDTFLQKIIKETEKKVFTPENIQDELIQDVEDEAFLTKNAETDRTVEKDNMKTTLNTSKAFHKLDSFTIESQRSSDESERFTSCLNYLEASLEAEVTLIKKEAETNIAATAHEASNKYEGPRNIVDKVYIQLRKLEKATQTDIDIVEPFEEVLVTEYEFSQVLEKKHKTVHKSINTFREKVVNAVVEARIVPHVKEAGTSALNLVTQVSTSMPGKSDIVCEESSGQMKFEQKLAEQQNITIDYIKKTGKNGIEKNVNSLENIDSDTDNEAHTDSEAHTELEANTSSEANTCSKTHISSEGCTSSENHTSSEGLTESEDDTDLEVKTDTEDDTRASVSCENLSARDQVTEGRDKPTTLITFFQQYLVNPLYQSYKSIYLRDAVEEVRPVVGSITLKTVDFPRTVETRKENKYASIWSTMRDYLAFPLVSRQETPGTSAETGEPQPQASSGLFLESKPGDTLKPLAYSLKQCASKPKPASVLKSEMNYSLELEPLTAESSTHLQTSPTAETDVIVDVKQKSSMWVGLREYLNFPVSKTKAGTSKEQNPQTNSVQKMKTSKEEMLKAQKFHHYGQVISYNAATASSLSTKPRKSAARGLDTPAGGAPPKRSSDREYTAEDQERAAIKVGTDVGIQATKKKSDDTPDDDEKTEDPSPKEENVDRNLTGFFADEERRADYVLVFSKGQDKPEVEAIKLAFLTGLVKAGIHLEAEDGVVYKNLLFVKLYASDIFLKTYAKPFGVDRPFRDSHEAYINPNKWLNWLPGLSYTHQLEWIRSIRAAYKKPLMMSTYDRSYVVHTLLRYQTFGEYENYYGLERLLKRKIVLDAYALHDGPYQSRCFKSASKKSEFNARQILYTSWPGCINLFWGQPLHVIFEYFGPKLGFYFTFYELYNKFLLITSIWGLFMMFIYQFKYGEYFEYIMNISCMPFDVYDNNHTTYKNFDNYLVFYLNHAVSCAECEGEEKIELCPYTLIQHYCLDLQILRYTDNPYIVLYSAGISFLALLFLTLWQRIEYFWAWMVEETEKYSISKDLPRTSNRNPKGIWKVFSWICRILMFVAFDLVLPICVILLPIIIVFLVFILGYKSTRSLSTNKTLFKNIKNQGYRESALPKLDRTMEYAVYITTTMFTQILLYIIEQLLHFVSYYVTKIENHVTYESFEDNLTQAYFWISFHYTFGITIFFTWIKGAFHDTIMSKWNMVFNITLPWNTTSYNMSKTLDEYWLQALRIFFTLNCGHLSCFRQGVVVYVTVLIFRVLFIGVLLLIARPIRTCLYQCVYQFMSSVKKCCVNVPSAEREYSLEAVPEDQITANFNHLFVQFALVMLFAPLFPLAPSLALLVNIWDIRNRAHTYLVHNRRVILRKAGSIGTWNEVLKLICYTIPIFHSITVARTEIFQRYMFNKVHNRPYITELFEGYYTVNNFLSKRNAKDWNLKVAFMHFLQLPNVIQYNIVKNHKEFGKINKERIPLNNEGSGVDANTPTVAIFFSGFLRVFLRCRLNGYLTPPPIYQDWPRGLNVLQDNYTRVAMAPEFYEWQFYKVLYTLLFSLFFALVAICLRCYFGVPEDVERRSLREQQLLRLRKMRHILPPELTAPPGGL